MSLTFGSLFAGIGGFDLGFERAGLVCKWQVEIDDYATKVLEKHWPDVRRHRDIKTFPPRTIHASYSWRGHPTGPFGPDVYDDRTRDDWYVDVICGGFPCQDISPAGKKVGIDGERSGLWSEFARVVRIIRPRFVVVENSSALLIRGMDRVLGDLATLGFDAEWEVLSACQFGAPHARERVFLVAHTNGCVLRASGPAKDQAGATRLHQRGTGETGQMESWWAVQPEPCSVVYGLPGLVDRLRPFGNAVIPQMAEWIGRRIVESTR